jgi:O-antigen/teichoic acid export membrane protein
MSWQVAAATATLLVVALLYHRFRPADLLRAKPLNLWRQWLSTSVPMGMTEGLRLLQSQMATYMLSLLSTTAVIGLFRVADSASALCLVPITIMNVVASPYFARLHAADDKAELQKITTAVSVTIFAGVAATAIPLSIFARPLLILAFGPEFAGSTDAFRIMLIANLLVTILGPTVSLANMTGLERYVTGATGLAALANAASAVLLIPLFGAAGGAISVAVGLFAWNGTLALVLRRHIGIDPTIFAINRSSFAAVFREARRLTLMPGPRRRDD